MARLKAFNEDRALDAAVDCFWMRGYEATSVRDLAEAMGIGGTSLYNAYGDKRALFQRSLERYAERSMERIARLKYPQAEAGDRRLMARSSTARSRIPTASACW
jgi:TetR/AcrR family transcriptional repressor of nem operon